MKRPRIPPTTPPPTAFARALTVLVDGELDADVDWVKAVEEVVDKILVAEGAAVDWVKSSSKMVMRIMSQNYTGNPSAYLRSFWQEIDQSYH